MQIHYPKKPPTVKPKNCYPMLCGLKNLLFNSLPFALIFLAGGVNLFLVCLCVFFLTLIYALGENSRNNRRLDEMAEKAKEAKVISICWTEKYYL